VAILCIVMMEAECYWPLLGYCVAGFRWTKHVERVENSRGCFGLAKSCMGDEGSWTQQ
jgi:hypothetical protein